MNMHKPLPICILAPAEGPAQMHKAVMAEYRRTGRFLNMCPQGHEWFGCDSHYLKLMELNLELPGPP